ncbi:MAG: hypothetical protein V1928_01250 [Parcubacteria group bacterium]
MYKFAVHNLDKAAVIILPQLNIASQEKLFEAAKKTFSSVIYDLDAKTQFFWQNLAQEKGVWMTGGLLIVGLGDGQSLWRLAEFFADFAWQNNLFDALAAVNVIYNGNLHLITLEKKGAGNV